MKRRCIGGMALAGMLLLLANPVFSDDKDSPKKAKPSQAAQQAEMEAWMKAATPGPEHKHLDVFAGSWSCTVKFWMSPDQPPQESKGTAERKWILGSRFLKEEFQGDFMGQPFGGFGLTGYDNIRKKYTAVWTDTLTTSISTSYGTRDESGKVYTWTREDLDPATGKTVKGKDVVRIHSEDTSEMVMYKLEDGKEIKVMEISFTRKKNTPKTTTAQ